VPRYIVDTNLYIEATRNDEAADRLKSFYARFLPHVYLHSVVAQELLAGAVTTQLERDTRAEFIEPFQAVARVITPSPRAWLRAGEIMARLVRQKKLGPGGFKPSFLGDCLIAASAREHGFVLVTRNTQDFELIRTLEPIQAVPPWPDAPLR
jgi:predicted nucleic acid-binding protein